MKDRWPFTDEELHEAAVAVRNAMLKSLPDPDECHYNFSSEFEIRIKRLVRRHKIQYKIKKVATQTVACILAVLITISMWVAVNTEARAAFVRWIRETWNNSFIYRFMEPYTESIIGLTLPDLQMNYLPENYSYLKTVGNDQMQLHIFVNERFPEKQMLLHCYYMHEQLIDMVIPNGTVTNVMVSGQTAHLYMAETADEASTLIWTDDDHNVSFSLSAYLEEKDFIRIAEHLRILE